MEQFDTPKATPESPELLWTARLRDTLTRGKKAIPALCIQGGGAKGAWEAGVLARLLVGGPDTFPSSIWGTSAGALNALWSRDLEVSKEPTRLLCYWDALAYRLLFAVTCALLGILTIIYISTLFLKIIIAVPAVLLSLSLYVLALRQKLVRLPGLIPSTLARLIIPKPRCIAPGPVVYTCVSNVDSATRPEIWDRSGRGYFRLERDASSLSAEEMGSGQRVDAFHVAVASASLPIIVHPTSLAGMALLDGGLVANLPAGFILSNGPLGGAYVVCIVPRSVNELSNSNPINYRTLRFLYDLRNEQAKHRNAAARAASWSGPAHTHSPVFVLSPRQRLKSGLICFWPPLLRREFRQGYEEATIFSESLNLFRKGDMRPMSEFLLEQVLQQSAAPVEQPGKPCWYLWANTNW